LLAWCRGLFGGGVVVVVGGGGGVRALPTGILGHGRLVVSWFGRRAGAGSQEDGGRGDVNVLRHHVPAGDEVALRSRTEAFSTWQGTYASVFRARNEREREQKYKVVPVCARLVAVQGPIAPTRCRLSRR
jgi:hypothetical protein